ncbi:endonuclease VII domain-containing protein [Dactylosporangium sp. NPDC048998]|uniref:endonuclease VII domain-containing protein n=1 Tax=Dactylosporangium sp. NPDC048998 TaxID=3363976 RepID=UPI00371F6E1A
MPLHYLYGRRLLSRSFTVDRAERQSRATRSTTCRTRPRRDDRARRASFRTSALATATPDGDRVSHAQVLREKYNLTPAEYDRMLTAQGDLCAICRKPETTRGRGGAPRRLAVDHNHRTGAVRKLLCHRCNLVTWAVQENPGLLDLVRAYLDGHAPDRVSDQSLREQGTADAR